MPKIRINDIDLIARTYGLELDMRKAKMGVFKQALTHHSLGKYNYDRLEYLGDSIFHLIISEYIYDRYDDEDDCFLSKLRMRLERSDSMIELAKKLHLGKYFQISRETNMDEKFLEDIFESFVAAFYISFGLSATKKFIIELCERYKDFASLIEDDDNYKDILLRAFHSRGWSEPVYEKQGDHIVVKDPKGNVLAKEKLKGTTRSVEQLVSQKAIEIVNKMAPVNLDKKQVVDKGIVDVYNECNKLMKATDLKNILNKYKVKVTRKITNQDLRLCTECMTHKSYITRKLITDRDKVIKSKCVPLQKKTNNRLFFLGSAVYHFIVAQNLYNQYNEADEEFLTNIRANLESKKVKYHLSAISGVIDYILISNGIESTHGRNNLNIMGKAFTAFIGAVYLMFDMNVVERYTSEIIRSEINMEKLINSEINYKTMVIKLFKQNMWGVPRYELISSKGPENNKEFIMGLYRGSDILAKGRSTTKKKASQLAAKRLYHKQR